MFGSATKNFDVGSLAQASLYFLVIMVKLLSRGLVAVTVD